VETPKEVEMRTATQTAVATPGSPSPQRIRWGAIFGGGILGIASLVLLTALWFALAYGSGMDFIRDEIEWFVGGSAILCLFIAGLLAGWLSGVHGAGSGFFNGVTIWALMLLLTVSVGVPAVLNVLNLGRVEALDTTGTLLDPAADTVLWATFLAILGGLVASGLGGAVGGAFARPANAELVPDAVTQPIVRPDRPDLDDRTVVVHDIDDEHERASEEAVRSHRVP
jgi:hypothetical protein